jgi:hypothetical protein
LNEQLWINSIISAFLYSHAVANIDIVKWTPGSEIEQHTWEAHLGRAFALVGKRTYEVDL